MFYEIGYHNEYFGVDYKIIWDIATNYLPKNKLEIDNIIQYEKKHKK